MHPEAKVRVVATALTISTSTTNKWINDSIYVSNYTSFSGCCGKNEVRV